MMKKKLGKHIASAFVLLVFGILAVGSTDTDSDTQKVQSQTPSYTLTADRLYREYNSNEVAADAKYKGKVIIVSGVIQDIGKNIMDDAYIVIGGDGFLDGVQCTFTKVSNLLLLDYQKVNELRSKVRSAVRWETYWLTKPAYNNGITNSFTPEKKGVKLSNIILIFNGKIILLDPKKHNI